jgi:hypothetical protein
METRQVCMLFKCIFIYLINFAVLYTSFILHSFITNSIHVAADDSSTSANIQA